MNTKFYVTTALPNGKLLAASFNQLGTFKGWHDDFIHANAFPSQRSAEHMARFANVGESGLSIETTSVDCW
jgi:hypothetical protein